MKRTTDLTAWGTMTGRGEGSFFFFFYSALPVCSLAAGADDDGRRRSAVLVLVRVSRRETVRLLDRPGGGIDSGATGGVVSRHPTAGVNLRSKRLVEMQLRRPAASPSPSAEP